MICKQCGENYPKRTGSYCGACQPLTPTTVLSNQVESLKARIKKLEAALEENRKARSGMEARLYSRLNDEEIKNGKLLVKNKELEERIYRAMG